MLTNNREKNKIYAWQREWRTHAEIKGEIKYKHWIQAKTIINLKCLHWRQFLSILSSLILFQSFFYARISMLFEDIVNNLENLFFFSSSKGFWWIDKNSKYMFQELKLKITKKKIINRWYQSTLESSVNLIVCTYVYSHFIDD